jgi:4-hydroxy-tetrahydrodipicolinate reductase
MSATRVAIAGAGGRMGGALIEAARATEGVVLGAALDMRAGSRGDVAIGTDVAAALRAADVLIDFTRPEGTLAHLAACREAKRGIVIGTTGFTSAQLADIRAAAREIPVVLAPNMSVGVNVMLKLVELASKALGPDYDIDVFEMHHKLKVDAPSGTALKLGEVAAAARATSLEREGVYSRHGHTGERKAGTIGFAVARGGVLRRHRRADRDHAPFYEPCDVRAGRDARREVRGLASGRALRHGRRAGAQVMSPGAGRAASGSRPARG